MSITEVAQANAGHSGSAVALEAGDRRRETRAVGVPDVAQGNAGPAGPGAVPEADERRPESRANAGTAALLPGDPRHYGFFQAVRILEDRFGGAPLGAGPGMADERIRLRPSASLAFPEAEVESVRPLESGHGPARVELTTTFLGVVGATSPMPSSYTEQVLQSDADAPQLRAFLDLFHHRLLSLLYRGRVQHRPLYGRREAGGDGMAKALLELVGVTADTSAEALGTQPERLLRYLGVLVLKDRPVSGLRLLLAGELGLPVHLEQAAPRWVDLAPGERQQLGGEPGLRPSLGRMNIGTRVLDRAGQLKMHIGPIPYARLMAMKPGGAELRRLVALTRFYTRQLLDLTLELRVPSAEVPDFRLGGLQPGRIGRMGYMGHQSGEFLTVRFVVPATEPAGCA